MRAYFLGDLEKPGVLPALGTTLLSVGAIFGTAYLLATGDKEENIKTSSDLAIQALVALSTLDIFQKGLVYVSGKIKEGVSGLLKKEALPTQYYSYPVVDANYKTSFSLPRALSAELAVSLFNLSAQGALMLTALLSTKHALGGYDAPESPRFLDDAQVFAPILASSLLLREVTRLSFALRMQKQEDSARVEENHPELTVFSEGQKIGRLVLTPFLVELLTLVAAGFGEGALLGGVKESMVLGKMTSAFAVGLITKVGFSVGTPFLIKHCQGHSGSQEEKAGLLTRQSSKQEDDASSAGGGSAYTAGGGMSRV